MWDHLIAQDAASIAVIIYTVITAAWGSTCAFYRAYLGGYWVVSRTVAWWKRPSRADLIEERLDRLCNELGALHHVSAKK